GAMIWESSEAIAAAALRVLADAFDQLAADVVISLDGHALSHPARAALNRSNVQVHDQVNQWMALREADLFVTQHDVRSTHEAIFHSVPMLSYPFTDEQLALARRCQ